MKNNVTFQLATQIHLHLFFYYFPGIQNFLNTFKNCLSFNYVNLSLFLKLMKWDKCAHIANMFYVFKYYSIAYLTVWSTYYLGLHSIIFLKIKSF